MTSGDRMLAFESFGARIGIAAAGFDPSALRVQLPPRATPISDRNCDTLYLVRSRGQTGSSGDERYDLFRDGEGMGSGLSLLDVRTVVESDMHFRVALSARTHLFVHAGVVRWKDRAILAPGRSMSGKSSLVMALVRSGAEYFSDEFAVLDPDGHVHAYPKPLSERRRGEPPRMHPAKALGASERSRPVPVGLTVVSTFEQGAVWRPQRITSGEVLMALFANTVTARRQPEFALDVLRRAVAGTEGLRGERGDASEAAAAILAGLSERRGGSG